MLKSERIPTPPHNQTAIQGNRITLNTSVIAKTSKIRLFNGNENVANTPIDITQALGFAHWNKTACQKPTERFPATASICVDAKIVLIAR